MHWEFKPQNYDRATNYAAHVMIMLYISANYDISVIRKAQTSQAME